MNTDYINHSKRLLRSVVVYNLDNDFLESAEFAAERLISETGKEDYNSLELYARVLFKRQRYKAVYNLTANIKHVGCAFLFGKAALKLNKPTEGILAITNLQSDWDLSNSTNQLTFNYENERFTLPDTPAFYTLLGKLYLLAGDIKESAIQHSKALKLNPYIWESFEELNKMGANVRVKSIYKVSNGTKFPLTSDLLNLSNTNNHNGNILNDSMKDPFGDSMISSTAGTTTGGSASVKKTIPLDKLEDHAFTTPRMKQPLQPSVPSRRTRSNSKDGFKQPISNSNVTNSLTAGSETIKRGSRLTATKVTSRLVSQPLNNKSSTSSNNSSASSNPLKAKTPTESTFKRGRTLIANTLNPNSSNSNNNNQSSIMTNDFGTIKKKEFLNTEELGEQHLLTIYSTYAKGYKALSKYDCFKAIRILNSLSDNHKNSPWVLSKMGRLHFEIVNYEESERYFKELRKLDKTRIEDMEYYSTLLWHLHKEVELSNLSREMLAICKNCPQTWVCIGNLFSITKETDEAIKCFERATQIDEKFSYAYTLQGHEYISNDAYENALDSFRYALLMEPRHYNALYGIGMVYLKLGNFNRAEFHFRKAIEINPVNVILLCCIGMMLEKLNQKEEALKQYELACKIQPLSALPLFKKAQLLFYLEDYDSALVDFEKLITIAPDEASVHFLLGQLYRLSNRRHDAIRQFTIALNLDPKGSHLVKEALESLSTGN